MIIAAYNNQASFRLDSGSMQAGYRPHDALPQYHVDALTMLLYQSQSGLSPDASGQYREMIFNIKT